MNRTTPLLFLGIGLSLCAATSAPGQTPTRITVDAAAKRHPISPLIYGTAFATPEQLKLLRAPLNRSGGNSSTMYNWRANATGHGNDWYFESGSEPGTLPAATSDAFVADSKAGGASPMLTVPMLGWVAKIGPKREVLGAFPLAKYGAQQKIEPYNPGIGNGVKPDGTNITGNDFNEAATPATPEFQRGWVQHLVGKWGKSNAGGVRYYLLDNEPSLWHSTHRSVHPQGETMDEIWNDLHSYSAMIKSVDPNAQTLGPEEWGWPGFLTSGADLLYQGAHNYQGHPDKDAHGGMDVIPWLLTQFHKDEQKTGQRLLDVLTVHIYPQGGDFTDDSTPKIQSLRNRSTRALWDANYTDESWIKDKINLIPRLKNWVSSYYPGTKIGITEYNWGAEKTTGGATAQADLLGIFGREGLDMATRWTTPATATPTFQAMKLYRNYDGQGHAFGSVSVSDTVPDPDTLSSFAALRASDGALTVMVINKSLTAPTPVALSLAHFAASGPAQVWQLGGTGAGISRLPNVAPVKGQLSATLPAQSVTLFVVPASVKP